jgi:hypothetical protein
VFIREFYSHGRPARHFVYTAPMSSPIFRRLGLGSPWAQEVAVAVLAFGIGFGLMPLLIFMAGSASLGRYEGASSGALYASLFQGFKSGSSAAWIVLLGPYGLYLLFKGLRLWWRASANLA